VAFTAEEQTRILHHLGYADWQSMAQSIQLGYPAASQPAFLVRDSFGRFAPPAEGTIRRDLCELESIEAQLSAARQRFSAKTVGEVELNPRETAMLREEYGFWQKRLADDLGVFVNPYSQIGVNGLGGGLNARVIG
jgi:hypothetical protein